MYQGFLLKNDEETILTVTENGFGKRTRVNEYPLQGRGGKGVINLKCNDKTGDIVEVKPVREDEELMVITSSGVVIRTPVDSVSVYQRAAQGVKVMRISDGEKVVAIAKVKSEKDEEKILEDKTDEEISENINLQETISEKEEFENKFLSTFEDEDEEMQFESEQGLEDSEEN